MRIGIVTGAGSDGAQPVDVAVMVGAEHVNAAIEATLALVDVVGAVGREVCRLTVAANQHPVLVVIEVGGAQPDRTFLVEEVPLPAQHIDGVLDGAGLVKGALGEPDIEGDAEARQTVLHLLQLCCISLVEEHLQGSVAVQLHHCRVGGDDGARQAVDVLPRIAVGRCRLTVRRSQQRLGEALHLDAGVIDVVLAGHVGPGRLQQPAQRVAEGGPAGVAQMHGSGRVGRDELEVDAFLGESVGAAVVLARLDDGARQRALRCLGQRDVEESRAGHVDGLEPRLRPQMRRQDLGYLPRWTTGGLGQLQCDVGRIVAVVLVLGTLDGGLTGDVDGQLTGRHRGANRGHDGARHVRGRHPTKVIAARRS